MRAPGDGQADPDADRATAVRGCVPAGGRCGKSEERPWLGSPAIGPGNDCTLSVGVAQASPQWLQERVDEGEPAARTSNGKADRVTERLSAKLRVIYLDEIEAVFSWPAASRQDVLPGAVAEKRRALSTQ